MKRGITLKLITKLKTVKAELNKRMNNIYSDYNFADDLRTIALDNYLQKGHANIKINDRININSNYGETIPLFNNEFETVELSVLVDNINKIDLIYSEFGFDLRQATKKSSIEKTKYLAHSSIISNYAELGQKLWHLKKHYKTPTWVRETIRLEANKILKEAKLTLHEKEKTNTFKR